MEHVNYAHEFLPSLGLESHQQIFPESYTLLMNSVIKKNAIGITWNFLGTSQICRKYNPKTPTP